MIKALDLVNKFETAVFQRFGYIYGASGQKWSDEKQKALEKNYNSDPEKYHYYKMSAEKGALWVGHTVTDCSGLFVWAFKLLGSSIYHGSDTIARKYTVNLRKIKDNKEPVKIGSAVFLYDNNKFHHIGLYCGNGKVIEARGAAYGVVDNISGRGRPLDQWDYIGELKEVEYTMSEYVYPTIRQGNIGSEVKTLQNCLQRLGYIVASDGIFGAVTEKAVRKYQERKGLSVDGICGMKTWKAIENELGYNPFTNNPSHDPVDNKATAKALVNEIKANLDTLLALID